MLCGALQFVGQYLPYTKKGRQTLSFYETMIQRTLKRPQYSLNISTNKLSFFFIFIYLFLSFFFFFFFFFFFHISVFGSDCVFS